MKNASFLAVVSFLTAIFLSAGWMADESDAAPCNPGRPAGSVVVATSHGDYTTISAALADICPPDAAHPFVIKVMPGTYTENVVMKSFVSLRGAGHEVTAVASPSATSDVITIDGLSNVSVSGLTLTGGYRGVAIFNNATSIAIGGNVMTGHGRDGVSVQGPASPVITDNTMFQNGDNGIEIDNRGAASPSVPVIAGNALIRNGHPGVGEGGIAIYGLSSPVIKGNLITGNTDGIFIDNRGSSALSSPVITGNTITGNGTPGVATGGIDVEFSSPTISANTISGNVMDGIEIREGSMPTVTGNTVTGNGGYGMLIDGTATAPTITNNRITGNSATYGDIGVFAPSTPNISFNVYDTLYGTSGVGQYNVNSAGGLAPAP